MKAYFFFIFFAALMTLSNLVLAEPVISINWINGSYTYDEDRPRSFRLVLEACSIETPVQCFTMLTSKKVMLDKDNKEIGLTTEISQRNLERTFRHYFPETPTIGKVFIRIIHRRSFQLHDQYSASEIPYADILTKYLDLDLNTRQNIYTDPTKYSAFLNSRITIQLIEKP